MSPMQNQLPQVFEVQNWGLIEYQDAVEKQLALVKTVFETQSRGTLVFCSHPSLLTTGRKTSSSDITSWSGPVFESSRGGKATYHGPTQMIIYPIVNLAQVSPKRRAKDIHHFLENLEHAVIHALAEFGVLAHGKQHPSLSWIDQLPDVEKSGVWVQNQKVASLGIGVRNWVTYHGVAIQCDYDKEYQSGFRPCGFEPGVIVSIEELIGHKVDRTKLQSSLVHTLNDWL